MRKIKIGTIGLSYNHKKNFFGLISDKVVYFKVLDWVSPYRLMMRYPRIKKLLAHPLLKNIHFAPFQRKVDLLHFFNAVSVSNTPWITTFETFLPRWGMDRFGLKAIASDSCKGIVAMSGCARDIMLKKVKKEFPEFQKHIEEKMTVIHPSQLPNLASWDEKKVSLSDRLVFTLTGNDFFRKGGAEVLRVFEKYIKNGADVELRIISTLAYGDYASQTTSADQTWAINLISSYPDRISLYQNIPNAKVLELLKSTHVGILPTYADTYGYSVLEYQSMACPVVSTNIRALPEINNDDKGWVIKVPKDEFGEGLIRKKEELEMLSKMIVLGLEKVIGEIISDPSLIAVKGEKSLVGLKEKNDPEKNGAAYLALYQRALR